MATEASPLDASPEKASVPALSMPAILLAGWSGDVAATLAELLGRRGLRAEVLAPEAVDVAGAGRSWRVLALGDAIAPAAALDLLRRWVRADRAGAGQALVLGAGEEADLFRELINLDRLFFLAKQPLDAADTAEILAAAWRRASAGAVAVGAPEDDAEAELRGRVLELVRRLSRENDLAAALRQIGREAQVLADAERARVWVCDAESESLATAEGDDDELRRESLAAGLTSFAARTGLRLRAARVGDDPRHDPELDNDGGDPSERFLAVPVAWPAGETSHGGSALAVFVAIRAADRPEFGDLEARRLESAGRLAAPTLVRLLQQEQLENRAATRDTALRPELAGVFRGEALDQYQRGMPDEGHVLEIAPHWMRRSYVLILGLLLAAVMFSIFFRIDEYAEGVGIVRARGRVGVTTPVGGTVSVVEVKPGQEVAAGTLLVRLYGAQEAAELSRVRREFELGLLDRLRRPADRLAAQRLGELRTAMQLAEARLEQRSVRAPVAGRIGDVRIEPGQLLAPGEVIASLGGEKQELRLLAVLPGRYRPQLEPGMTLRLELYGFRYAYQEVRVASVSDKVFGPSEARRFLGPGGGDLLDVAGPVAVIEAALPGPSFTSDGRVYDFHDGLSGRVEVRLRSERVLFVVIPALKYFFEGRDGGR